MNGKPITVDGKLVTAKWENQTGFIQIGVEPFYVNIQSGKTYWIKMEYTVSDFLSKTGDTFELKKWINFRGDSGKVELRIPLTNFISDALKNLEIDLVTPNPESNSIRDNFQSIIWKTPSSNIDQKLVYEVTVRYFYDWNWISIMLWIISVIIIGGIITFSYKIIYERWIKPLIVRK